ncbi:putative metal-dependent peptidase [Ancylobacter sp. 3268]|uniref:vWA domain-containing protein n=1 Tax=Ancylobacter sp. 3268 TaxID=2817752 RepID=UPI00285D38F3|nr:VWA-like domain-containing protein [Ancylobacter sp. 3268]MDR6954160.1 putative metal-dependent peptidase [Ancylobacter sp. 3268]
MNTDDKILAAKTALMWDHPFFSVLLVQLKMIDATDDPRINTMATDGRHLYYDRKFVDGLKKDELVFVLAHEVMHNAMLHSIRRQERHHMLFNIACDYAINGELKACNVGTMPKAGLIDDRFTGLGAEEIYRILLEENPAAAAAASQPGADPGGCGGVLDGCAQHDEAAKAELKAEIMTQVQQAAMVAKATQAGKLPAGIARLIDQLLAPKVDWRAVLRRFIDESSHRDFSWAKPNRRLIPHGIYTPSTISDGVSHIVIAVDTSGSIDDAILRDFAAEINGAFGEGAVDRLSVIYADAQVNHIEEFETGDELVLHPAGGGGTAFSHTFKTIADQFPDARATIYLTDMHVCDFGEEPPMPTLWGVYGRTKDFGSLTPPFGECINISV